MNISVLANAPAATSLDVPAFPLVRYDTERVVYQEALLDGQYLLANASAMGRPKSREWVWQSLHAGVAGTRPLRTRQHAFQIEVDGQLLADRWEWADAGTEETVPQGQQGYRILLRHQQRPIEVAVHTRLDDTPFLVRWLVITNRGDRPAALAQVYPWSGQVWEAVGNQRIGVPLTNLQAPPFRLGRYVDTSALNEGSFDWMPLPAGTYGFESRHGRSGWGIPFFVLHNEATGETLVCHFAWSGNWQVEFFNDAEPSRRPAADTYLYTRVGLAGPAPLRVLAPGESATTPAVHFGFLFGDLNQCVQALHTHVRRSVAMPYPPGLEHRVEVNHTGYTRNAQISEHQLYEEIDVAADVGVELFMLDAGWFGEVSDRWFEAVGDWDRESPLLTSGVKAAFDRVRQRGMLCGLWVEAERMGSNSVLLHQHPEWQMEKRGEKIPNLDLSRPEVAQYLEETIVELVERYQLDCFRLDYNISVGEGGEAERDGYTENVLWRYYDALYRIFDNVHTRFPHLLLENCSSGGGRMDLGIMSRFHWTQVTDNWSPAPTLKIINGVTLALPPERCMTLLGAISDGVADIDFMLRIGLFGHYCASGIFPSMDQRQMAARERWRHTIDLYKRFVRPILPTGRLIHHTPIQRQMEAGEWVVLEYAAVNRDRAFTSIFRLGNAPGDRYHLSPQGLNPSRRYRVTFDSAQWDRDIDGATLMEQGLHVHVPAAFTSELLLFEAI